MPTRQKAKTIDELSEQLSRAKLVIVTDYRGLKVGDLQVFRGNLRPSGGEFHVAKNTLTKIAARDAGVDGVDDLLTGPTAIAFIKGDPVEVAKGLRDFAKANDKLVIKGGFLEGKALDSAEITKLADLESREVLLGRLAGGMKANLSKAAALFQAPLAQAARAVGALQTKVEQETPAPSAPAETEEAPAAAEGSEG